MNVYRQLLIVPALILAAASVSSAANITYEVNLTIGAGSVTGDIVTDGTIGTFPATPGTDAIADIIDWNLLLNDGTTTFDLTGPLSGDDSTLFGSGTGGDFTDLSATSTQLLFDFDLGEDNELVFTTETGTALCFNATGDCTATGDSHGELLFIGGTSNIQFRSLSGTQAIGTAEASSTPEPSTFALLGAGIILLLASHKQSAFSK